MMVISMINLFLDSVFAHLDLLVWIIAVPLVTATLVILIIQYRKHKQLKREVALLSKVKRNAIEYDLVLKAMKLTVWRIDVPTRTITYESDYRKSKGLPILPPGSDVEAFCNTMVPESKERIAAGMMDLVEGRRDEFHSQYEVLVKGGEKHCWGEMFATVDKRDLDGRPITIVGTSMNIDHQKEIEWALKDARNKAEESDRLKSAFLANMSHEIRTPLNAIVGFSDVLTMVQSEEERNNLIRLIKQNNAHLLRLFDDMVNMSKLEAGSDAVKKERFELNPLLTELANRYTEECKKKGLSLEVETLPEDPRPFTDRRRLREILNQYLDNALKFTSKGTITLGYHFRDGRLRVWVQDTGKGIPAEHCSNQLFESFFKVDEFIPGTGLGLSICRSLAQSLDGTVGVESKEGEGSCFWVEIEVDE